MSMLKALKLIASNGKLLPAGNAILNAHSAAAFADGFIVHAPRRAIAWKLTEKGKVAISVASTGVPWPAKYQTD